MDLETQGKALQYFPGLEKARRQRTPMDRRKIELVLGL
jgi:hypothetical protein